MNNNKYSVGIDISKSKLDICVLEGKKVILELCIENTSKGLTAFKRQLQKMNVLPDNALICCEHTGIYTSNLVEWSTEYGYNLWIEKPIQIKKSIGLQRGKNDKIDAYRIATYAFRYQDEARIFERPRKVIEELKYALTMRRRLINIKKQLQVPLKELSGYIPKKQEKAIFSDCKKSLKGIEHDIKKINKKIEQIINQDDKLSKSVKFASSVAGVGTITAASIITATNELKSVRSGKELACYVGVVPFTYQSGSSVRGKNKVSHFANKPLKSLLHLGALSAKTHSEEFREYYERKIAEGKHVMSVINAIRNKIVRRIYACITNQRIYEEEYSKILA